MNLLNKFKEFFTNSKIKELEEKIAQIQKNQIKDVLHPIKFEFKGIAEEKLIQKCIYNVGTRNIDVVFTDGDVISGVVEQYIYEQIRNAASKEEILNLLIPKNIKGSDYDIDKEEDDIKTQIAPIVSILSEIDDFEVVGEDVFLKGVKSIAIPSSIVAEFIRIVSEMDKNREKDYGLEYISKDADLGEEYNSLLMFTVKLLANPIKESRESLLSFIKNNKVQLTPSGNMCLYRRFVTKKQGDKQLEKFVTQSYTKIKHNKKSPKNYWVFYDGSNYKLHSFVNNIYEKEDYLGNLYELYQNLGEKTKIIYTDNYTKSYEITIPGIYKIREGEIDKNKQGSCGGFLHCASLDFDYSSFGDQDTLVLVNPMNAAKIDTGFNSKIGVVEMYVACTLDNDFQEVKEFDLINFDTEYEKFTIKEIEECLKNKELNKFSITEDVTNLNFKDLKTLSKIMRERLVEI